MALGAALAGWRAKRLQSSDTLAPTDHVEVTRGFGPRGWRRISEIHHDDGPTFQPGD